MPVVRARNSGEYLDGKRNALSQWHERCDGKTGDRKPFANKPGLGSRRVAVYSRESGKVCSRNLSSKAGSLDGLNGRTLCGWNPCARQMRCTKLTLTAAASVIAVLVHCVASLRGLLHGQRDDPLHDRGIELRMREGRVLPKSLQGIQMSDGI
jgi:hypothetical protein